jgi:hypothetical protein
VGESDVSGPGSTQSPAISIGVGSEVLGEQEDENGEWDDPAEDGDDPRCKSAHEAIKVSKHGFDSSVDEITRIKQALLSRRAQRAQSVT